MKYVVTLNGKKYEVEVERGQATAVYMGDPMGGAPMQQMQQPMMQQMQQPVMQQPVMQQPVMQQPMMPQMQQPMQQMAVPMMQQPMQQMGAQPMMQQPMASMATPPEAVSGEKIAAPMPGTILEVCCQPGAMVKAGDVLFILEAMKMENEICASRDGVIAGVHINKGSTVETGTALCTLS